MSKRDQITGQGPQTGNTRSHAKNHSRRVWNLNLQTATIKENGKIKKVKVCAKTIKTLKRDGKIVKFQPNTDKKAKTTPTTKKTKKSKVSK